MTSNPSPAVAMVPARGGAFGRRPLVEPVEGRTLFCAPHAVVIAGPIEAAGIERAAAPALAVTSLTLVNAKADRDLFALANGSTVNRAVVGDQLNVRADVSGAARSVRFVLDGTPVVEGYAPFALFGGTATDYAAGTLPPGRHTLVATAYAGPGATGTPSATRSVTFTVVVDDDPPPSPPPPPPPSSGPTIEWRAVTPNPIARTEAVGNVVGGKLYVFGGFNGTAASGTRDSWTALTRGDAYDPAANRWTRVADMPEPFTHATGTVVGRTIWFVGGYLGNHPGPATARVWRYDTDRNAWSRWADLPAARGSAGSAVVDGKLYVVGGMDRTRTTDRAEMWALDLARPDRGWVRKPSMPTARNHVAVVAAGGKLYAVGGQLGQEERQVAQSAVEVYDPTTNAWTKATGLPFARSHATSAAFALGGRVVIVGGETAYNRVRPEVYAYDPRWRTWKVIGRLPAARSTTVSGVLPDGRVIVSTGNSPTATSTTWIGTVR